MQKWSKEFLKPACTTYSANHALKCPNYLGNQKICHEIELGENVASVGQKFATNKVSTAKIALRTTMEDDFQKSSR